MAPFYKFHLFVGHKAQTWHHFMNFVYLSCVKSNYSKFDQIYR